MIALNSLYSRRFGGVIKRTVKLCGRSPLREIVERPTCHRVRLMEVMGVTTPHHSLVLPWTLEASLGRLKAEARLCLSS